MRLKIDDGAVYGNFTVVKELTPKRLPSGQTNRVFKCVCVCGGFKDVRIGHLVRDKISSCGCLKNTRNGLSQHPLYKVWQAILLRASGHYDDVYRRKNINYCNEWKEFEVFYSWAISNGYKKGLQIDRINGEGNYEPSNCRFVTPIANCNNRENTYLVKYRDVEYPFMIIIRKKGLINHHRTIRRRIERGWSIDRAIDTPIRIGNYKTKIKEI